MNKRIISLLSVVVISRITSQDHRNISQFFFRYVSLSVHSKEYFIVTSFLLIQMIFLLVIFNEYCRLLSQGVGLWIHNATPHIYNYYFSCIILIPIYSVIISIPSGWCRRCLSLSETFQIRNHSVSLFYKLIKNNDGVF